MSNNKYKILIADPDIKARKELSELLESNGYKVITAATAAEAVLMFKSYTPDIIISEFFLPGANGIFLIEKIKKESGVPIIILSDNGEEYNKVAALDAGADDYITKPCGAAELSARIRVALRNAQKASGTGTGEFSSRGVMVDYGARRVFAGGNEVSLTQNEYNILALLTLNSGKMLTYREIIKAVWGDYSDRGSIKRLQVNIANIRKKLGAEIITNVPGVGYRAE